MRFPGDHGSDLQCTSAYFSSRSYVHFEVIKRRSFGVSLALPQGVTSATLMWLFSACHMSDVFWRRSESRCPIFTLALARFQVHWAPIPVESGVGRANQGHRSAGAACLDFYTHIVQFPASIQEKHNFVTMQPC